MYTLLSVLLLTACEPEDPSTPEPTPPCDTGHAEDDACVAYTPSFTSEAQDHTWDEPNDEVVTSFTTPSDPAGGIVEVTLSAPPAGPSLTVERVDGGAATVATGALEGETAWAAFEVGPDETWIVRASPFFNAPPQDYPLDLQIQWSFAGRMDCFEPNDSSDQAAPVALDIVYDAWFGAPKTDDTHVDEDHQDWYLLTVEDGDELDIELLALPADTSPRLTLFDGDDVIAQQTASGAGQPITLPVGPLDAGTYPLWVEGDITGSGVELADGERPPHFDTPYQFRISRR